MITASRGPNRRNRLFWAALVGSVLVHLIVALLVVSSDDALRKLFERGAAPRPPADETVAISTALHLEKRTHPVRSQPPRATRPIVMKRHPLQRPHVTPVAAAVVRTPPHQAPAHRWIPHELARLAPHATPVPRTTAAPGEKPRHWRPAASHAERVAYRPHRVDSGAVHAPPRRRYRESQIAAIESDLARSIARDRSVVNPLSNVSRAVAPASSIRRGAIDFSGVDGRRHGFEGVCEPIKSWPSSGYVYFYVTCRVAHDDGLVREEAVPWPIRYPARRLSYDADGPLLPSGAPVAPPLPGWRPDPSQELDPDVILYLRKFGYPI